MDYDWLNFPLDRQNWKIHILYSRSIDCLHTWRLEEQLDHSYFTSQLLCLIWLTAVSFDRLIEPRVIDVTTILDGITLMISNASPDNSNSPLTWTEPHFPKISPQFSQPRPFLVGCIIDKTTKTNTTAIWFWLMQRTDYIFKVANRSKTESQNSKQNHKTQNRITKPKTESQNPKQKHKTQNRITKPESQNSKQNHKTQNRITPVVPSKTIPDSRTKWAKCRPVFRPKRLKNIYILRGGTYLYGLYKGVPPGTFTV